MQFVQYLQSRSAPAHFGSHSIDPVDASPATRNVARHVVATLFFPGRRKSEKVSNVLSEIVANMDSEKTKQLWLEHH